MKDTKHIRQVFHSFAWVMPHMKGACNSNFFAPPPGALGRGQKVKYHLFQLQSQFQRFLYQTLCVFSKMKDTKHIRRNFHSEASVMPQGSDLEALGMPRGSKKFKHGHVAYQIDRDDEQNRMQVKFSS